MTDELRKAAEQALAYMKSVGEMDMYPEDWTVAMRLEAALAAAPQAEQEPVAWLVPRRLGATVIDGEYEVGEQRDVESFPVWCVPQPEQEPVAWRWLSSDGLEWLFVERKEWAPTINGVEVEPLYAAPPAAPQWIACAERMPEAGVEVLVWLAAPVIKYGCQIAIDTWDEQHEAPVAWSSATIPIGEGWDSGADWQDITHWMPLPAAPREQR